MLAVKQDPSVMTNESIQSNNGLNGEESVTKIKNMPIHDDQCNVDSFRTNSMDCSKTQATSSSTIESGESMEDCAEASPFSFKPNELEPSGLIQKKRCDSSNRKSRLFSNHIMVNECREKDSIQPLGRSRFLDSLAKAHAEKLAGNLRLRQSCKSLNELRSTVKSRRAGENVQRGDSVELMHEAALVKNDSCLQNIMDPRFVEMGVGTCRSLDGKIYMVQLFRGEPEE